MNVSEWKYPHTRQRLAIHAHGWRFGTEHGETLDTLRHLLIIHKMRHNPSAPKWRAFCHVCLGGGKMLCLPTSRKSANIEATSHMHAYGHQVSLVPVLGRKPT